jgi:type II secretory pathway component PulM
MSSDSGRPRLQISIQQPWFARTSRVQRALVGCAVGAFIFLSGGVLDWFVTRQYLPRISLMLAGAAVALAVGLLVFQILTDIQERYQAMMDRLQRVVELNHHIRNALQVIAYHNVPERSERAIQQVNAEVLRIESVLREVSAALGDNADVPVAIVPIDRRKG